MFLKHNFIIKKLAVCVILLLIGVFGNGQSLSTDSYGESSVFKVNNESIKTECCQNDQLKNPLFIPEVRNEEGNTTKVFYALGKHKALGFSPFSIEDCEQNNPISRSNEALDQLIPIINGTGKNEMTGVWFGESKTPDTIELNGDPTHKGRQIRIAMGDTGIHTVFISTNKHDLEACVKISKGQII